MSPLPQDLEMDEQDGDFKLLVTRYERRHDSSGSSAHWVEIQDKSEVRRAAMVLTSTRVELCGVHCVVRVSWHSQLEADCSKCKWT